MDKTIDISKSIYDLCSAYPEIKEIMQKLGFGDITKPGMLGTAGRFMTIPKGAAMKSIGLDKIKAEFEKEGFQIQQ